MLKIHEVATLAGVHINTVRALEKAGVIRCERTTAGYRMFDPSVVGKIQAHYKKKRGGRR